MSATMAADAWLTFLDQEYLRAYIADGGSAVKFAVPLDDDRRDDVLDGVVERAEQAGHLVLRANAATTPIHRIDRLFHRLAQQVPWRDLSRRYLEQLAKAQSYAVPTTGTGPFIEGLAEANDLETEFLRMDLRKQLVGTVFRDATLAKDFRVAMTQLCLAELTGGAEGETTILALTEWLTGANPAVSAVKPYEIRTRINRTNARYLLESMLVWIRSCGYRGSVVLLDTARVTVAKNPKDYDVYYTKAGLLDAYELLRQFIDGTDRLHGCLMVVVPAPEFIDTEKGTRGMGSYEALMFRVIDEVRDRDLANPMASLVRLEEHS